MPTEWTPSTEDVRNVYARTSWGSLSQGSLAAFDRWLAAHDAEVRAPLEAEVEQLREAVHVGAELDNHHNAALCPYCSRTTVERAEAAEAKVRAARIVAEHWRDALMATIREHPEGALGTHPLALVLDALDGETRAAHLGIDASHPDAARLAALADPTSEPTP